MARHAYLLLTLLCAALYLPGLSAIPPTDRDESRFMQATKQMIETGDYVHIRFQNEPRNKKPVGIYWLQAASVKISTAAGAMDGLGTAWAYRLPSAFAAWIAVLAACWAGRRLLGPREGLIAGAVLATSLMTIGEAHLAKTDAALLAASSVAFAALARMYALREERTLAPALMFWAALGVGILLKGPIIVLVAGAALAGLSVVDRDLRWLKRLRLEVGIPFAVIIVLPWLLAVSANSQASFINDAVREDIWPKLVGGQEGHGAWPGTHLASAFATLWPWSALAPFVLIAAWRRRAEPVIRASLGWLIPGWILFELVPTKLPHYTLPLFPAFALLTAALLQGDTLQALVRTWAGRGYRLLWAVLTLAAAVALIVLTQRYGDGNIMPAVLTAALMSFAAAVALFALEQPTPTMVVGSLTVTGLLIGITVASGVIPHHPELDVSGRLAAAVHAYPLPAPVAIAGFHEPSTVFLLGTDTIQTAVDAAADHLIGTGALAVVPDDAATLNEVTARLRANHLDVVPIGAVEGYEYTRGRWVKLALIAAEPFDGEGQ